MSTDDAPSRTLDQLEFDNRFTNELPADPSEVVQPRQVHRAAFSRVKPKPTAGPTTVAVASEVAGLLELDMSEAATQRFADVFSGNELLEGMDPFAMAYAGHQFGNFAGQLGDGRAIGLGEVQTSNGAHWMLQLKGAGPTPYSRRADGLAVLRSSIREFLCSEAMHHLGVPTTRALSLVRTGDQVMRDMLYDGNPALEPGAVVCRIAPTFIRFGNFELFSSRGEIDELRQLAAFTIDTEFPDIAAAHPDSGSAEAVVAMFTEVARRTATMIVHWMRVGFVHGVMNTDNMSILGLTIDYGPYGWLEDFDAGWTPNTTDASHKRYRFGQQPQIAQWNLVQLANALYPLVEQVEPLQEGIAAYAETFETEWNQMMADKLGLESLDEKHGVLVNELLDVLQLTETDMTIFFRKLADVPVSGGTVDVAKTIDETLAAAYYLPAELTEEVRSRIGSWLESYALAIDERGLGDAERKVAMNAVNPKFVLRNYLAQVAIDKAEVGDDSLVVELLEVLRRPYDEQPGNEYFAEPRPDWARTKVGCSMLSCSS